MTVRIFVTRKDRMIDVESETLKQVLSDFGFNFVHQLKMSECFQLELADGTTEDQIHQICRQFLVNTDFDQYEIEVLDKATAA